MTSPGEVGLSVLLLLHSQSRFRFLVPLHKIFHRNLLPGQELSPLFSLAIGQPLLLVPILIEAAVALIFVLLLLLCLFRVPRLLKTRHSQRHLSIKVCALLRLYSVKLFLVAGLLL